MADVFISWAIIFIFFWRKAVEISKILCKRYVIANFLETLQVNLCQKLLFLHQLTHNMTTHCSSNYKLWTEIVFDIQNNFCTQHVLPMFCKKKSFWPKFTCIISLFIIISKALLARITWWISRIQVLKIEPFATSEKCQLIDIHVLQCFLIV